VFFVFTVSVGLVVLNFDALAKDFLLVGQTLGTYNFSPGPDPQKLAQQR